MNASRCPAFLAWSAALAAGFVVGCAEPEARRATLWRQEQVRQTVGLYTAREGDSPRRLAGVVARARQGTERQAQRHVRNRRRLAEWARRDRERWQARQPLFRQRIAEDLAGKPSEARWAFRAMFY